MRVLRISFLGLVSDQRPKSVSFFRDVMGLDVVFENPNWTGLRLPSGDRDVLEVFDPGVADDALLSTQTGGQLIVFEVDDVVAARDELARAGIELLSDVVWHRDVVPGSAEDGHGWFFFRAPDGRVYGLQQDGVGTSET